MTDLFHSSKQMMQIMKNINIVHEEDCGQDDDLVEQIDSETSYHSLYSSESGDELGDESEDLGKKPEIWSRSQFSTVCKCDYITNNISESFNAWVAEARERPVLDLLDTIRQKIMVTMDKRRRMATKWKDDIVPSVKKYVRNLSRGLAAYEVQRCSDSKAEVSYKGQRCEVLLADGICSCRKWQVSGIPCVHAMAFIFSIRGAKWEEYVDLYFSVEKTRVAYNLEIAPMPDINQWTCNGQLDGLLPPLSRRPAGRPKKNRIRAADEIKSGRHKCARCGGFGHQARTCKEPEHSTNPSTSSSQGRY
ncbi:uncharacterized protein LOC120276093 [Dioscorea cayenensis subsp. rotundata]|uniref:Uncharacterized protein LOC120276093 n=1 Tax=Dioscorea cayennensis subsp. rotundata TaxID=55577 RepID=A0AB40CG02_DIOCR|nr:uncharacterized protein LOC120276093 [Dioscorea cayenensis subsp. rotundata]